MGYFDEIMNPQPAPPPPQQGVAPTPPGYFDEIINPPDSQPLRDLKQLGSGMAESVISMPGWIGDVAKIPEQLAHRMGQYVRDQFVDPKSVGAKNANKIEELMNRAGVPTEPSTTPLVPFRPYGKFNPPTSQDMLDLAAKGGIKFREPGNTQEKFAREIGRFIPGAFAFGAGSAKRLSKGFLDWIAAQAETVPERLKSALKYGVGPAVTSEAIGEHIEKSKNPELAPYGRAAAALLTGGVTALMSRPKPSVGPSVAAIKGASGKLYDAADALGLVIKPRAWIGAMDRAVAALRASKYGVDEGAQSVHPSTMSSIRKLVSSYGLVPRLQDVEAVRQFLSDAAHSSLMTNPKDALRASFLLKQFDRQLNRMTTRDVMAGGDPQKGLELLRKARRLWARASRTEIIDEALYKAKNRDANYTQAGRTTGIKQNFRAIIDRPGVRNQFMPSEKRALEKVVRTEPGEKALRTAGRLAPRGVVSGVIAPSAITGVSTAVGTALGAPQLGALTGAALSVLAMGGGEVARQARRLLVARNAAAARGLISTGPGYKMPPWPGGENALLNALNYGENSTAKR